MRKPSIAQSAKCRPQQQGCWIRCTPTRRRAIVKSKPRKPGSAQK